MTPELSVVIFPMLKEWDWLTPDQTDSIIELAESLIGEQVCVAIGQLCARSVRFLKENNELNGNS